MAQQFLKNSTHRVNEIFQAAVTEALNAQVKILIPEFLLFALLEQKDSIAIKIAIECKLDEVLAKTSIINGVYDSINQLQRNQDSRLQANQDPLGMYGSQDIAFLLEKADLERKNLGDAYISTGTLFLAFFDNRIHARELLTNVGFNYEDCKKALINLRGNHRITSRDDEAKQSKTVKGVVLHGLHQVRAFPPGRRLRLRKSRHGQLGESKQPDQHAARF